MVPVKIEKLVETLYYFAMRSRTLCRYVGSVWDDYPQNRIISRTLVGNKIVDYSNVVAPTSSF